MSARSLRFTGEGTVEVRREPIPEVTPETVLVEAEYSAISAGTEGLFYRGEVPRPIRSTGEVETLPEEFTYPLEYGYAIVGRVVAVGEEVTEEWLDERVFAYAPHRSHVRAEPGELVRVPASVPATAAPLFANVETAVSLALDANPAVGERVAVFGQGVVGLLTTGLLAGTPLTELVAVEPLDERRERSRRMGADHAIDPTEAEPESAIPAAAGERPDLSIEVSGNPDALEAAVETTRFDGRVLVGSWYGTTPVELPLGGRFHRHRIDVESSQVSTIAPRHRGRWSHERRREVAWDALEDLPVEDFLTHRIPLEEADDAYRLLEERPETVGQILLTYGD